MITTSARQLFDHIIHLISDMYEPDEARSISFLLLEHKLNLSRTQILSDKIITTFPSQDFNNWVARLLRYEPIQYILGETEFLGRTFLVNPHVLIPRPETEELVSLVLKDTRVSPSQNHRILDIGTGSGCIAVLLATEMPEAEVWAIDVSAGALAVAEQNAERNQATVHFRQMDFLEGSLPADLPLLFDCIVSNPPYIALHEKDQMHPNVLRHEPHTALFVPDADPMVFYRHIAAFCQQHLSPLGKYYVEMNENLSQGTAQLMKEAGLSTTIQNDIFGKPRMLSGIKMP